MLFKHNLRDDVGLLSIKIWSKKFTSVPMASRRIKNLKELLNHSTFEVDMN